MTDIILIGNRFPPKVVGGAEVTVSELALELQRRGKAVRVLSLSDDRFFANEVYKGIPVTFMPNTNIYNQFDKGRRSSFIKALFFSIDCFNVFSFAIVLFYLLKYRPKQVWTHNLKGIGILVWGAAKISGAKLIHFAHDYWLICPSSTMFKNAKVCSRQCRSCVKASFFKRFLSLYLPDSFVSVSAYVRDRHLVNGYFGHSKVVVAHNGRPLFTRDTPISSLQDFRVGYIGRIDETKGLEYIFRAARALGFQLHVAGNDPFGILERLQSDYPEVSVVYYGFVRPEDFYPNVSMTVVPSLWAEPFGNVAFEGWDFGVPSVVFRSGGLPEVLYGFDELVVDISDDSLCAVIERLMLNPDILREYSRKVRERRPYFTISRQVDDILNGV